MPLSTNAQHYLQNLWGERLRSLIAQRESERENLRRGLIHAHDIYTQVGFLNYIQPYVKHVSQIGNVRAECLLRAYSWDGQPLSLKVIEEIAAEADQHMENASIGLVASTQNEAQSVASSQAWAARREELSSLLSEMVTRMLNSRRETKEGLQRRLTIQMYESQQPKRTLEETPQSAPGSSKIIGKPGRQAIVLSILIASPSDVSDEREIVTKVIHIWNAANSRTTGIMLEPVRWETHAFPSSGERPQAIINKQIVDEGDFLIAIFGNRLGTPTGQAESGTIEEIERYRKSGKLVALYFSSADIPRDFDPEQLKALNAYKHERRNDSLYFEFDTPDTLWRLVSQHLPSMVNQVREQLAPSDTLKGMAPEPPSGVAISNVFEMQTNSEPPARGQLQVHAEIEKEYPDGPFIHVMSDQEVSLTQLDYLDETGAKLDSDKLDLFGQDFQIQIDYKKIVMINNLKNANGQPFNMQFRLQLQAKGTHVRHNIPALIEPSFKMMNGTQTYFMKIRG